MKRNGLVGLGFAGSAALVALLLSAEWAKAAQNDDAYECHLSDFSLTPSERVDVTIPNAEQPIRVLPTSGTTFAFNNYDGDLFIEVTDRTGVRIANAQVYATWGATTVTLFERKIGFDCQIHRKPAQ